jgi:Putative DNA-binding domain
VRSRVVVENHYCELKRTYERTDSGRREMAKDIAALALDGGSLVIGVDEDDTGRAVALVPVKLAGFAERLDQAALHRCDPPVTVRIEPMVNPLHNATGLLVVEIPPSPLAPHMVDGRYYGRGERSIRVLSDAEVLRLHQTRALEAEWIERALNDAIADADNLLPRDSAQVGRLVIVAEPVPIRRLDLMAEVYARRDWWRWAEAAESSAAEYVRLQDENSPALAESLWSGSFSPLRQVRGGTAPARQDRGVVRRGGPTDTTSGRAGYFELDEPGAIRLALNNLFTWERNTSVLDWHMALSSTVFVIGMFQQICNEAGLHSQLDVGVYLDNLADALPRPPLGRWGAPAWDQVNAHRAESYRSTTRITNAEMEGDLTAATERLWGRMLRGMGLGDQLRVPRSPATG